MNSRHFCWVNSMKDRKKPAIRFKGFTEDWEQRKLGEVLRTLPFKPFLKIPDQDGKYEIIQQGNEPIIGYANGEPCEDFRNIVIFGDHTLSLYKPKQPFFVATDGVRILQGTNDMDGYYLLSLLEGNSPKSEGYKRYYSILVDREVLFTENYYEQVKIGLYFKQLDNLITLHQRKYDKLVNIKKSMLEKMFPRDGKIVPDIRFSGFTEDWEQRKLGDIFKEYSEKDHEELPALMIIQGGGTMSRDESDRSLLYDKANLANYKMVKEGDFIVHLRSFEGGLEKATNTGIISPAYHTLHGENTDSRFYYSYFRSKKFIDVDLKPHVYGIRDGRSIDIEGMKTVKIPFTNYREQKTIGTFIKQLDRLITLHQRKLEKLKNIKKSCLEKMFI